MRTYLGPARAVALMLVTALVGSLAFAGERDEKPELPGLPRGVRLGMEAKALLKARPGIKLLDGKKAAAVDLSAGTYSLYEEFREEFHYGEFHYILMDGRCVLLGFLDKYEFLNPIPPSAKDKLRNDEKLKGKVYDWETFAARRADVVAKYRKMLGNGYRKQLTRMSTGKTTSYLCPSLEWVNDKGHVSLTVTGDYPGVDFTEVVVAVNVWDQNALDLVSAFVQNPKPELVDALFKPLDTAAKKEAGGADKDTGQAREEL